MVALSWRSKLTDDETTAVFALVSAAAAADGQPPLSEAALLRLRHGEESVHLLAHAAGGELAGYAQLVGDGAAGGTIGELVVHPGFRRQSAGGAMVGALLERTADAGKLRLWAYGGHPAAERLTQRYGFTPTRVLWQMRRSLLAPLEAPKLPDGVVLRTFEIGRDEAAFVEVNNRAFEWHPEQGGWDVEQVRRREAEPWFDADGFLLAVSAGDGRLLGFHWTKAHTADLGEVYVLGVDPAEHGRGLGKALTLAGLRHLRSRGMTTVMLYVEADNTPAVRTYQRLGFTHWETDVVYSSP